MSDVETVETNDDSSIAIFETTLESSDTLSVVEEFDLKLSEESTETIEPHHLHVTGIEPVSAAVKLIEMEHCYARPHNWRPETSFLRPTKTLFVPQRQTKKKSSNPLAPLQVVEDFIDVEAAPQEAPTIYDFDKAKQLMSECERHAACSRIEQGDPDWEEKIPKETWMPYQLQLFNSIVDILNTDQMSRLAFTGSNNEAVLRRTVIDKSVKRFRRVMASIIWDMKLTQWLHQLLLEHLDTAYLTSYLDILQTLKAKLPTFVDKMMHTSTIRGGILSNDSLFQLLKRPWDPVAHSLSQDKPKKLPGNPIIVVVPSSPCNPIHMKRHSKWLNLLSNLGAVHTVYSNIGPSSYRLTVTNALDQMLTATRAKIQEVKSEHPNRPIVLAGFNAGASLALQVAHIEAVLCVLCLGFSLLTAEGKRGDPDDNLLELQCPVLFVIGQRSHTALQEDLEDLRERMRVETGLIVVGSADDNLRISKKKKRSEGITQSVVDRCIVDEVGEFVSGLLLSPYPPQIRQSPTHVPPEALKRLKADRKRNNSNCSSLESEPPSPTPRITRPGQSQYNTPQSMGRPPGSKTKSKLEMKWAQQVAQGTPVSPSPSSSPPPTPTSTTSDTPPNTDSEPPKIKPTTDTKKPATTSTNTSPAKLQAMGLSRPVISSSPLTFVPGSGIRTIPANPNVNPKVNSGIKILENITLNPNSTAKLVSSSGRTIDLSKITVLNNVTANKPGGPFIFVPENKIKPTGVKPLVFPVSKSKSPPSHSRVTKYITSKKQLMGTKPPKPMKKLPYIPTSLPPPTNLTSQDIMDLPIIFADDNQVLSNNVMAPNDAPSPQITTAIAQPPKTIPQGKYVFVNKSLTVPSPSPQNILKRTPLNLQQAVKGPAGNAVKYAKIILSKRLSDDPKIVGANKMQPPEMTVKKMEPLNMEHIDLESELVATTVPKPNFNKNVTLIYKKGPIDASCDTSPKPTSFIINEALQKRSISQVEAEEEVDDNDPDYIPSKNLKLDI